MRRHLLFAIVFISFGLSLNAQLANGSKLTGNVTGEDLVTAEKVDVQAWLAEGKSVVIDVFATWCGPCWGFHATGWLDDMNERYGPNGTDQIRILGVEADSRTAVELVTMQGGVSGTANYSIGDWTTNPETGERITYPIIDNAGAASTLSIAFFPTLYIIRPDGTLTEIGGNRYNDDYWVAAMGINPGPNAVVSASLPNNSFCENTLMQPRNVSFENVGDAPITTATINVMANGNLLESVTYTGAPVGIFNSGNVSISAQNFTETTEIMAVLADVDGNTDVDASVSSTVVKPELVTDQFTFLFTTDFYAVEASWVILDDTGKVLASDTYQAGTEDSFGGGGPDALTTHEYQIETTADINCLTVALADSYGDGYTSWTPGTHAQPGFGIVDQWGNVVKESGEGFFRFSATEGFVNTAQTSAIPELDELESSNLFPNPVANELNIVLNFNKTVDYSINIVNAYGQLVQNLGNFNSNKLNTSFDVSELSTGMYIVSIQSELGQKTMKFNKL